jgi:hypothetical protein
MNPKDIRDAKVSEAVRRRNPHLFGVVTVCAQVGKHETVPALVEEPPGHKPRARRVAANKPVIRVSLICFRRRLLDDDNAITGQKAFRDAIAESLGIDDRFIQWEYQQFHTQGQPGTAVKIDITNELPAP